MCTLRRRLTVDEVIGYKVVVLYNGKYVSPATGIEYKKDWTEVPVVKRRRRAFVVNRGGFNPGIIYRGHSLFQGFMIGRTAVFLRQSDAEKLCRAVRMHKTGAEKLTWCVVSMRLSSDLMEGTYLTKGFDANVVAGRRCKVLEEVFRIDG